MTQQQNIKAILESNFAGFKDEIINIALDDICQLCSSRDERMLDFIYDWLAEIFGYPCDYGFGDKEDISEYMYEHCKYWCEDCGDWSDDWNEHNVKDCWKKYLETKFEEKGE